MHEIISIKEYTHPHEKNLRRKNNYTKILLKMNAGFSRLTHLSGIRKTKHLYLINKL